MLLKNTYRKSSEQIAVIVILALLFMMFTTVNADADLLTWTNGGGNGSWHNENNWTPVQVPGDEDDVIIPVGTDPVTYSSGTTNLNTRHTHVWSNVVVVTDDGRKLETEELFFDNETELITNEVFNRFTRQHDVMTGIGLEAMNANIRPPT